MEGAQQRLRAWAKHKLLFRRWRLSLCNKPLSVNVTKMVLTFYIEPVWRYGYEYWNVNKTMKQKLAATEMWFLRQMMQIPQTAKVTNKDWLLKTNESRTLYGTIRQTDIVLWLYNENRGIEKHCVNLKNLW